MRSHGSTRSKGCLPSDCNSRAWRRTEGNWEGSLHENVLPKQWLAVGGFKELNQERKKHGEPLETFSEFVSGSDFWFQSFQNWQSEFLAVFSIMVLSIFLRQSGSPESKEVDAPDSETGA
jgi:hypothetical protein